MIDNKIHSKIHLKNPLEPIKIIFLYLGLGTSQKMEWFWPVYPHCLHPGLRVISWGCRGGPAESRFAAFTCEATDLKTGFTMEKPKAAEGLGYLFLCSGWHLRGKKVAHGETDSTANMPPNVSIKPVLNRGN